ncbi:MAG TPA: hypothetical protein VHQ65_05635 [Thermoanaerobaculia bacterium]|nr:hypothetical protein [Thermoanaerobaculia bacterium]
MSTSRGHKVLWSLVGITALLLAGTASAVVLAVQAARTMPAIEVQVDDHAADHRVAITIPAFLVAGAAWAAPRVMPAEARAELEIEMAEAALYLPMLEQLAADFEAMPDATLVEVIDGGDRVRVDKRGGDLLVRVRSADADVDVRVPAALVRSLAGSFAG